LGLSPEATYEVCRPALRADQLVGLLLPFEVCCCPTAFWYLCWIASYRCASPYGFSRR